MYCWTSGGTRPSIGSTCLATRARIAVPETSGGAHRSKITVGQTSRSDLCARVRRSMRVSPAPGRRRRPGAQPSGRRERSPQISAGVQDVRVVAPRRDVGERVRADHERTTRHGDNSRLAAPRQRVRRTDGPSSRKLHVGRPPSRPVSDRQHDHRIPLITATRRWADGDAAGHSPTTTSIRRQAESCHGGFLQRPGVRSEWDRTCRQGCRRAVELMRSGLSRRGQPSLTSLPSSSGCPRRSRPIRDRPGASVPARRVERGELLIQKFRIDRALILLAATICGLAASAG